MSTRRKKKRRAPARRTRKKVGAMSTGGTIALVGGGLLLAYLVTRPKTPALPPSYSYPPGYLPVSTTNPTITALNDGTSVLNNLFNNLF